MPDNPLPVALPGKVIDFKAMYDAQFDAEDLWFLCEVPGGQALSHLFFRKDHGWSLETVATAP